MNEPSRPTPPKDSTGRDRATLRSNDSINRTSQRRLIERLSGWRLIAFFISAGLNLGLLAGLIVLPLFLDPTRLFIVTAFVLASHCVVLIGVAGFRFPISAKIAIGSAHATACVWALASADAMPFVLLGKLEVSTLYLIPMLTLMMTIGGVVVARLRGFHRSKRFSVGDVLLLVTAFAILFPLILQIVPGIYFSDGLSPENLRAAFAVAAVCGVTVLVVSNLYLRFIPTPQQGLSPLMMSIGWFLFAAMFDWNLCQFGLLIAAWVLVSLVPVCGTVHAIEGVSEVAK